LVHQFPLVFGIIHEIGIIGSQVDKFPGELFGIDSVVKDTILVFFIHGISIGLENVLQVRIVVCQGVVSFDKVLILHVESILAGHEQFLLVLDFAQ
jgi:hypothetical protein